MTKDTPFIEFHRALGAKIVEFAGYWMPIQYSGIVAEHKAVRTNVGIFDISHMGEFLVEGPGAVEFVDRMTTNNVRKLGPYQVQYSTMLYDDGGIVDDLLVYNMVDHLFLVVNASNLAKDFAWLSEHLPATGVKLTNLSDEYGLIAVQGPNAEALMKTVFPADYDSVKFYWAFPSATIAGEKVIVSRTGYTGEDGFEIYTPIAAAKKVWTAIWEAGRKFDLQPIGLGARDSLRLEMKYCLYGNDIDQTTNPLEAGIGWTVKMAKGDFNGKPVLEKAKAEGLKRNLVCLDLLDKAIPRQHMPVLDKAGNVIGEVTSGTMAPSLDKPIAIAYVPVALSAVGSEVLIDVRGKHARAVVVEAPFYKNGTHK